MSSELKDLMIDVRDRVIRIETRIENLPELEREIKKHGEEILKAQVSMKVLRWFSGVLLISVPATVMALVKIFKS
jgi:hypothetical protein